MTEQQAPIQVDFAYDRGEAPFEANLPPVDEILSTNPHAIWSNRKPNEIGSNDEEVEAPFVSIEYPGISSLILGFDGAIGTNFEGEQVMEVGTMVVPPEYEGNHLGERLTRSLAYEAVRSGCKELEVDFLNPASLKAFIRTFGFDRIHFHEKSDKLASVEGAVETVGHRWGLPKGERPKRLRDRPSTKAWVDLKGIDTSGWEAPVEADRIPEFYG